jgi:hypothetical protein
MLLVSTLDLCMYMCSILDRAVEMSVGTVTYNYEYMFLWEYHYMQWLHVVINCRDICRFKIYLLICKYDVLIAIL